LATLVISYARVDQPLVRGVVKLLRAAMSEIEDAVYWDDDFEPGEAWSAQIRRSIDGAPQLFVFWCAHSAVSPQVREELAYALSAGKIIVPVLLDDTCLSGALTSIHGVDLRTAVRHAATRRWLARAVSGWRAAPASAPARDRSARRWLMPGIIAAALLALSLLAWLTLGSGEPDGPTAMAEAPRTPSSVVAEAAGDEGPKPAPPDALERPVEPRDSRLEESRLRQEQLSEAVQVERRLQQSLRDAEAASRIDAPKVEETQANRPAGTVANTPPPTSGVAPVMPPSSPPQVALRRPPPWPSPRISEEMPAALMRTLQRRESQRREARLRRALRQQQATHQDIERSIQAEVRPPVAETSKPATLPPSASSEPAVASDVPIPTQVERPAADGRPLMVLSALLLALVGLIGLVVWRRRRSRHAGRAAAERAVPDAEGRAPDLLLDQRSQDALVRQFRRYLRLENPS
jgi:hypothetical protein